MRPRLATCAALAAVLALSGCAEMEAAMEQATTPKRLPTQPTVAVVDTGIDASHPLLAGRVDFPFGVDTLLHATQGVDHGTAVASVIAAHTQGIRIASVAWDYDAYGEWQIGLQSCLKGNTYGCNVAWQHATGHMIEHGDLWGWAPVVNFSHGLDKKLLDWSDSQRTKLTVELIDYIRATNPEAWYYYTQARTAPQYRSIAVRAAGNARRESGRRASDLHRTITALYSELWGHSLFVTAIDPATGKRADYASPCGPIPRGWNGSGPWRHFCVAAVGTHEVALPGGGTEVKQGTSFSAPLVAALLTELHVRCSGLRGTELVRRLLATADRTPPYDNTYDYGAGVITAERARQACRVPGQA